MKWRWNTQQWHNRASERARIGVNEIDWTKRVRRKWEGVRIPTNILRPEEKQKSAVFEYTFGIRNFVPKQMTISTRIFNVQERSLHNRQTNNNNNKKHTHTLFSLLFPCGWCFVFRFLLSIETKEEESKITQSIDFCLKTIYRYFRHWN